MGKSPNFPHVRAMNLCLACAGHKEPGFLLCWPCHNEQRMLCDGSTDYYGPHLGMVFMRAEAAAKEINDRIPTRGCTPGEDDING